MTDKKHFRLWLAMSIAVLAVIWGNSCLPGEESGSLSNGLLECILEAFPSANWLDGFLIRKAAHFCEFAALAFSLGMTVRSYGISGSARWFVPLSLTLMAACVDETVQIFSPGRCSALTDVWIDFFGGLTGLVFLSCLLLLTKIYRTRRTK